MSGHRAAGGLNTAEKRDCARACSAVLTRRAVGSQADEYCRRRSGDAATAWRAEEHMQTNQRKKRRPRRRRESVIRGERGKAAAISSAIDRRIESKSRIRRKWKGIASDFLFAEAADLPTALEAGGA